MHKDTALAAIQRKLGKQFITKNAAAEHLGVTRQALHQALTGKVDPIPQYLLDYADFTLTTKHIYGSNK